MKTKLNKQELNFLISISNRLQNFRDKLEPNDFNLVIYDNGTVCDQLSCAIAGIETILQEYEQD